MALFQLSIPGSVLHRPRFPSIDLLRGASKRGAATMALLIAVLMTPGGLGIAAAALSEAYLAVAVFVAGTLVVVQLGERLFSARMAAYLSPHQTWQVPLAAVLGAVPGCGGAIIVVTRYARGQLGFGSVVAALSATMGDAMFLLLASEPHTALGVSGMSVVTGIACGYLVDAIHGPGFLRPAVDPRHVPDATQRPLPVSGPNAMEKAWALIAGLGLIIGLLVALGLEVDGSLANMVGLSPVFVLGVVGALLALAMWLLEDAGRGSGCAGKDQCPGEALPPMRSIVSTTNLVTAWAVFAFIVYELLAVAIELDPAALLPAIGVLTPMVAIGLGLIPGCGPQLLVTSLYVSGSLPLSAQLGNAIANDGDALFPVMAVAPKAALVATLYGIPPAVIVAYGWYALFE